MESIQPILRCRYNYDPLDRLISQLQPDAPAHQRFYCKSRLATEIQGAIGFSVFQNNDLLLAQHKNQDGAVESTLLATDLQRSVLHTLTTDQQQHPIAYSPYGHRQAESGLASLLGFNGERPDPVTGHYLLGNGYRAFNPVLMRFNSPDSWSPFGKGGLNSYTYCLGNPIFLSDPTGHNPTLAILKSFVNMVERAGRAASKMFKPTKKSGLGRTFESVISIAEKRTEMFDDGIITTYKDRNEIKAWVNSPKLQHLSFNATRGEVLQAAAKSPAGKLIRQFDELTGEVNVKNLIYNAVASRKDQGTHLTALEALDSAAAGNAPGILPERARNAIRSMEGYADPYEVKDLYLYQLY